MEDGYNGQVEFFFGVDTPPTCLTGLLYIRRDYPWLVSNSF